MTTDNFFAEGFRGNEVKKFLTLIKLFDRAFSYESGFDPSSYHEFHAAFSSMNVQVMEFLKLVLLTTSPEDFERLAVASDEKMQASRSGRTFRMISMNDGENDK